MAIRFGSEIAIANGLADFQIETDFLLAVQEVQKGSASSCEWGSIIFDICNLSSDGLVSVGYVRREANFFAHNIAKLDIEGDDDVLWWGEVHFL